MIVRIKKIIPLDNFILKIDFDNDRSVEYDMNEDIDTLPGYNDLKSISGLWSQVQLDESRTCIYWNDYIDMPSDILYEYGKEIDSQTKCYDAIKT